MQLDKRQAIESLEQIARKEGLPLMRIDIYTLEQVINILIDDVNGEDDGK